jgi:hypothetical protein
MAGEREAGLVLFERATTRSLERRAVVAPGNRPGAGCREPRVACGARRECEPVQVATERQVERRALQRRSRRARRDGGGASFGAGATVGAGLDIERAQEQARAIALRDRHAQPLVVPHTALAGIARGGEIQIGAPGRNARRAKRERRRAAETRLAIGPSTHGGAPGELGIVFGNDRLVG